MCVAGFAVNRAHDQENKSNQADGVNSERKRGRTTASFRACQPASLPRVKKIAGRDRESGAGKDCAGDKVRWKSADQRAKSQDEQELKKIIDK